MTVQTEFVGVGGGTMLEKLLLAFIITLCLNLFLGARLSNSTHTTAVTYVAESPQIGKWIAIRSQWQQNKSPLPGI